MAKLALPSFVPFIGLRSIEATRKDSTVAPCESCPAREGCTHKTSQPKSNQHWLCAIAVLIELVERFLAKCCSHRAFRQVAAMLMKSLRMKLGGECCRNQVLPAGSSIKSVVLSLPFFKTSAHPSITTSATSTPAIHTLHTSSSSSALLITFRQRRLRHTADTCAAEVCFFSLHATQTAQLLVALLLPFRDQRGVGIVVLQQPFIERL